VAVGRIHDLEVVDLGEDYVVGSVSVSPVGNVKSGPIRKRLDEDERASARRFDEDGEHIRPVWAEGRVNCVGRSAARLSRP
jgi:hypothetical protein